MSEEIKDVCETEEYEDAGDCFLEATIRNCAVMQQCMGKFDPYGNNLMGLAHWGADIAGRTARKLGGDDIIAFSIYCGVVMVTPAFGEIGKQFLMDKIPNFSYGTYGRNLVNAEIDGSKSRRKEKVYQGVYDILEYQKSDLLEAKAVLLTMEILSKVEMLSKLKSVVSGEIFKRTIEAIKETGEFRVDESYDYMAFCYKLRDKGMLEILKPKYHDPSCRELLEKIYQFFLEHFEEIPEVFYYWLPKMEKEELVAYYVATRPETGIAEFVANREAEGYQWH